MKETISKWSTAVEFHNSGKYGEAVETYCGINDISARMYYNLACAYVKLNNTDYAIECLSSATTRDEHLAIAYFQRGTLFLQRKSAKRACIDLEEARTLLRGNTYIDYKPLGLYVRLSSVQILHNLALAFALIGRAGDARDLLTEALHDADHIQGKTLQTSLERINENRPELIPAMQISLDKVFTPPKHVTRNLEKKGIMRKARVISASNTDDRSPTFEGSKRVRELKKMEKPPKSPLRAIKRFAKNAARCNRSASDQNESTANNSMKKSEYGSDRLEDDGSSITPGSKSPFSRTTKRVFQAKQSNSMEGQVTPGLVLNRSSADLVKPLSPPVGSDEKRFSLGLLTGVRKYLNNKQKRSNSEPSGTGEIPVLVMRGFGSTGDIRKLHKSFSRSESQVESPGSPKVTPKKTSDYHENLNFNLSRHRNSLGSVFGDYLTVTRLGLSLSCDILTAIATPTESENDLLDDDVSQDSFKGVDDELEYDEDKPVNEYDNTRLQTTTEDQSTKPKANSEIETQSNTGEEVVIETQSPKLNTTASLGDQKTKKPRPPPPSYPPPPLPPHIVITV